MWFYLALISAVLGAVDVVLNKKCLNKVSAAVLTWSLFTLSIPPLAYLALKDGIPSLNQVFFIGVFGSSLAFIFAKTIINETLKQNAVSKIYPITAFAGVFTYFFGLIMLSESIRPVPILGLLSVVFGSYILNADQAREDFLKPFKLLFLKKSSIIFLIAIMLGSLTAVFDKLGLNNTTPTSPVFIIFVEQIIMSIMMGAYLLKKESKTWFSEVKNNFGILFLNSIVFIIVGLFVFNSYGNDGPVALVLGVKRLQIFFILLLGYLFFKDKPTRHAWLATGMMILGVLMIRLG